MVVLHPVLMLRILLLVLLPARVYGSVAVPFLSWRNLISGFTGGSTLDAAPIILGGSLLQSLPLADTLSGILMVSIRVPAYGSHITSHGRVARLPVGYPFCVAHPFCCALCHRLLSVPSTFRCFGRACVVTIMPIVQPFYPLWPLLDDWRFGLQFRIWA